MLVHFSGVGNVEELASLSTDQPLSDVQTEGEGTKQWI